MTTIHVAVAVIGFILVLAAYMLISNVLRLDNRLHRSDPTRLTFAQRIIFIVLSTLLRIAMIFIPVYTTVQAIAR